VIDYLPDIESDFSAIHGIWIDIEASQFAGLTSRRFFQLAERLPAYQGVMQAHVMAEEQRRQEREQGTPVTAPAAGGGGGVDGWQGVKVIPLTPEMAAHGMDALGLGGVVDYATSSG